MFLSMFVATVLSCFLRAPKNTRRPLDVAKTIMMDGGGGGLETLTRWLTNDNESSTREFNYTKSHLPNLAVTRTATDD